MKINQETQQIVNPIYNLLTKPKSLHKFESATPLSVFPLIDNNKHDIYKDFQQSKNKKEQIITSVVTTQRKNHKNQENLSEIFKDYIYKSNQNTMMEDNNTFGQMHLNKIYGNSKKIFVFPIHTQKELTFQSRFQSGNLFMAAKGTQNQYNLVLHKDINSRGCTQWFYFQVRNNKLLGKMTLNILNFIKDYSAYQDGMKICIYSVKNFQKHKIGWHRGGESIEYYRNNIPYGNNSSYYSLSFTYHFQYLNDEVYFAYSYPYTYSKLQRFLEKFEIDNPTIVNRKRVAQTAAGNYIEMLTITNNFNNSSSNINKPTIYISARIHPGETISSFICQGLLEALVKKNNKYSEILLNQFVFKIIPMVNPDGVIHGNYRCSLNGVDLNRHWKKPDRKKVPEIFFLKQLIKQNKGQKLLYIDLHGHSKKKGIFMYGCSEKNNPYKCKQFPYLLHKKIPFFNYFNCNFVVQKSLYGTGRITFWRQLNFKHSYTLQTSFFGPSKTKKHFLQSQYKEIGSSLFQCIFLYFSRKKSIQFDQSEANKILNELYQSQQLLNSGQIESQCSSNYEQVDQQIKIEEKNEEEISHSPKFEKSKLAIISKINSMDVIKSKKQMNTTRSNFMESKVTQISLDKSMNGSLQFASPNLFGSFRKTGLNDKIYSYYRIRNPKKMSPQPLLTLKMVSPKKLKSPNSVIFPSPQRQSYTNYQKARHYDEDQGLKIYIQSSILEETHRKAPPNLNITYAAKRLSFHLKEKKNKLF